MCLKTEDCKVKDVGIIYHNYEMIMSYNITGYMHLD